jgi:steroid 5-alpha reductase family enzyme
MQQQWNFQTAKRDKSLQVAALSKDYANGFLTHGLFAFSRHPNFFAEQCFWVSYALFCVPACGGVWANVGFVGAALLIFNFHFSTDFGEVCLFLTP